MSNLKSIFAVLLLTAIVSVVPGFVGHVADLGSGRIQR